MYLLHLLVQFLETKRTSEPKIFIIEKILKMINDTAAGCYSWSRNSQLDRKTFSRHNTYGTRKEFWDKRSVLFTPKNLTSLDYNS